MSLQKEETWIQTMMPGENRGKNSGDVFTIQGASKTASKALEA